MADQINTSYRRRRQSSLSWIGCVLILLWSPVHSWTTTGSSSTGSSPFQHHSGLPPPMKNSQQQWQRLPSARTTATTMLHDSPLSSDLLRNECVDFMENHEEEQEALLKRDRKIYLIPVVVSTLAFLLFPATSQSFHAAVESFSLGTYTGELSDDIRPLINGPVTLTISILFGSLVSMTISTLYSRQTDIHYTGIATVNEARRMLFLAQGLEEPDRSRIQQQVKVFTLLRLRTFFRGDMFSKDGRLLTLDPLLLDLHQAASRSDSVNGFCLGQLYDSTNRLKEIWVQFTAATQRSFTPAHYANLAALATSLLTIYLWETDDADLLAAHTFELRVAWAMLMGTMASLVAIIIDLGTPISNIITMIRKYNVSMDEMIYFGMAKDLTDQVQQANGAGSGEPSMFGALKETVQQNNGREG